MGLTFRKFAAMRRLIERTKYPITLRRRVEYFWIIRELCSNKKDDHM
jgi:hypothetical protein